MKATLTKTASIKIKKFTKFIIQFIYTLNSWKNVRNFFLASVFIDRMSRFPFTFNI